MPSAEHHIRQAHGHRLPGKFPSPHMRHALRSAAKGIISHFLPCSCFFLKLSNKRGRAGLDESLPCDKTLSPGLQRKSLPWCFLPSSPAAAGAETKSRDPHGRSPHGGVWGGGCTSPPACSRTGSNLRDRGSKSGITHSGNGLYGPGRREGFYHLHFGQKSSLLKSAPEAPRCCLAALSHLALKAARCWSPPQGRENPGPCSGMGARGCAQPPSHGSSLPPALSPVLLRIQLQTGSLCSARGSHGDPMLPEAPG